jgi:hypothetical protein
VRQSVSALLAVISVSAFAAAQPAGAETARAGNTFWGVSIGRAADAAPRRLSGVVVRVRRASTGSGMFLFAHGVTILTKDGDREAYVTSLDAAHDPLPQIGDRCDAQCRPVQTSEGPGLLIDRLWCNGQEIALTR